MRIHMLLRILRPLAGICTTLFVSAAIASTPTPLDNIIAIVNDGIITKSELDDRVNMIRKNLVGSDTPLPSAQVLNEQVLQQMINQDLQMQLADKGGIHVTEEEVNNALEKVAQQNKMTVEEMFNQMQKDGDDYTSFRNEIREEMIIHQLQLREVAATIVVTPQEITDYLRSFNAAKENNTQYHIENILIALPEAPTPAQANEAKALANELLAEVLQGNNFRGLAVEHSNGEHALKGGDLGWRKLAELPDVFAIEIPNLKKGEVAGPFRTANGYHLIKLVDIRSTKSDSAMPETDEQLRIQIGNQLYQRKLNEKLQNWLMQLRANSYIKIIKPNTDNAKS